MDKPNGSGFGRGSAGKHPNFPFTHTLKMDCLGRSLWPLLVSLEAVQLSSQTEMILAITENVLDTEDADVVEAKQLLTSRKPL